MNRNHSYLANRESYHSPGPGPAVHSKPCQLDTIDTEVIKVFVYNHDILLLNKDLFPKNQPKKVSKVLKTRLLTSPLSANTTFLNGQFLK